MIVLNKDMRGKELFEKSFLPPHPLPQKRSHKKKKRIAHSGSLFVLLMVIIYIFVFSAQNSKIDLVFFYKIQFQKNEGIDNVAKL